MSEHTIWRFTLKSANRDHTPFENVLIPQGARIISVGVEQVPEHPYRRASFWAIVPDPEATHHWKRTIWFIGTGKNIDLEGKRFLATINEPPFWWHIFVEEPLMAYHVNSKSSYIMEGRGRVYVLNSPVTCHRDHVMEALGEIIWIDDNRFAVRGVMTAKPGSPLAVGEEIEILTYPLPDNVVYDAQ